MEPIIILCFSPWNPYLKTDEGNHLHHIELFFTDPRHISKTHFIENLMERFYQTEIMELMIDIRLMARPAGMSGK